jgi:hypothetical protein
MSEHTFQLAKDALIALPTITFTGFVAWWSWRRDQERLRVHKIDQGDIGVLVTNLSLFPIRISAVGIRLPHGRIVEFADARRERTETEKGPLTLPELSSGSDGPRVSWPVEVPSYGSCAFMQLFLTRRASSTRMVVRRWMIRGLERSPERRRGQSSVPASPSNQEFACVTEKQPEVLPPEKLKGAAADMGDLMEKFAAFRKEERELEDSRS